jgi:hypothetical protein
VSRGPLAFKQQDVTRAVRGAVAAGIEVQRVEIDPRDGKIILVIGKAVVVLDDLDSELQQFEASHGKS